MRAAWWGTLSLRRGGYVSLHIDLYSRVVIRVVIRVVVRVVIRVVIERYQTLVWSHMNLFH